MEGDSFLIAILPPEEVQEEITQLKHQIATQYNSHMALKSPPHITLHMPFKWKENKHSVLLEALERINASVAPFKLELCGFDYFEPRVIFVDVVQSAALFSLQEKVVRHCRHELNLTHAHYKDRGFHPHVTIGFRDLKKADFYSAQAYFDAQKYDAQFEVHKVSLLKRTEGTWHPIA